MTTVFTIGQIAKRSGVSNDTIRLDERYDLQMFLKKEIDLVSYLPVMEHSSCYSLSDNDFCIEGFKCALDPNDFTLKKRRTSSANSSIF